jgi:RND family efflux transporter MFP subunit
MVEEGRKKAFFILNVILILMISVAPGCGNKSSQENEQKKEPQGVLVDSTLVTKGDISEVSTVSGKIIPRVEVNVVPKMPGRVAQVFFDVGDQVHKGDVLISLDDAEYRTGLESSEAALAMSKIGQSQSQTQYQDAAKNLERMKNLYEQGAISKQQLESAQTGLEMADPAMAAAKIRQAEAAVETAKTQIENTVIKSPADGIISARTVEVGEMAAQSPVMTVVDIDTVEVETNITESKINKLKEGQKVDVIVSAVSKKPLKGTISSISPAVDSKSGAFPMKIKISNPGHKLKPGMFAEIKLTLETRKGVVIIPKEAVVNSGKGKYVFVIRNNKALQTNIKSGLEDDTNLEVVSGLKSGDKIVVTGQQKLQDQTPVMIAGSVK